MNSKSSYRIDLVYSPNSLKESVDEQWNGLQSVWKTTCKEILGKKENKRKEWLSNETWDLIEHRNEFKTQINHAQSFDEKKELQTQYWEINKHVKGSARQDKINFIEEMTRKTETAAGQRNMK